MNYGFRPSEIQPTDYIHGDGKLGDVAINPSGQWDTYLPDDHDEIQNSNGFETYCCVTEGTLHAVEILEKFEYGSSPLYSVRFLATVAGTGPKQGNDPNTVAASLRKNGCPQATDYSFKAPDYQTFYKDPPTPIKKLAKAQFGDNNFGDSWLPDTKPETIKGALTFSPVGVSIYWKPVVGPDGLYHRPPGGPDVHWLIIEGFDEGVAWHCFDSYTQERVKLAWDYGFGQAKRYTLHRVIPTAPSPGGWVNWVTFIQYWRNKLGL